jgi:hypothetical protein
LPLSNTAFADIETGRVHDADAVLAELAARYAKMIRAGARKVKR